MPTYVTLLNFTDQGIRNIKDSPKRAEAYKKLAKEHGCAVKEILWIHGHYDIVTIVEAPIGIGGRLATPPLPHHRAYGSVPTAVRSS